MKLGPLVSLAKEQCPPQKRSRYRRITLSVWPLTTSIPIGMLPTPVAVTLREPTRKELLLVM